MSKLTKKDQEAIRDLSESKFESEWTKAAADLEAAKERVSFFSQESQRRATAAKVAAMNPEELKAIAQYVSANGIESEEGVQNG